LSQVASRPRRECLTPRIRAVRQAVRFRERSVEAHYRRRKETSMKLHALMVAAALALAGPAFAQAPNGTAKAPAETGASANAGATVSADKPVKKTKKKAKARKAGAHHHHSAARDTRAMGAGMASPVTDLDAGARQARIDQAYDNWLRLQARR
jgi:hypothetical protein